jgi:hypothetical protein
MRLTVLQQTAKGLPEETRDEEEDYPLRDPVMRDLARLKWYLWHGNVYKALQVVQSVEMDRDAAVATSGHGATRKLLKAIEEFHTYIDNNAGFIPNYGERYRYGERISTGCVESTVNQVISQRFCKHQQMQWTARGAHLLLQIRTRVLNGDWEAIFHGAWRTIGRHRPPSCARAENRSSSVPLSSREATCLHGRLWESGRDLDGPTGAESCQRSGVFGL